MEGFKMKKMKILRVTTIAFIIALVSIMLASTVHSAPLRNVPLDVEQPDGTVLELFASGDSSFNYVHDSEGRVIMQHPRTGFWVYADLDEDGLLVATDQVVADDGYFYFSHQRASSSSPMDSRGITTTDIDFAINDHLIREREEVIFPELESLSVGIEPTVGVVRQNPIEGHIENIIIMIAFADQDPVIPNTLRERIDYTFNTSSRSLSNAIYTLSDGLATIDSTVLGANNGTVLMYHHHRARRYYLPHHPVTNPYGYLPSPSWDSLERRVALLGSAARAVEGHPLLQGRTLDTLSPGRVDSVTFIVRGNPAGWGSILWPHAGGLNDGSTLNGATINTYSLLLEGNAPEHHNIHEGVIIHEQLHIFSFPDLYRYHHHGNPVGWWDIMSSSMIFASPNTHTLQRYAGWGTPPTEITGSGTFTLSPLGTSNAPHPTAYVIPLGGNRAGEFILLEYRSARNGTMFDSFAGIGTGIDEGIIISRINPSFRGNAQSRYPDFHDEVYIFRPDTTARNVATASVLNAPLSANSGRPSFGSASGTGYTNVIYRHDGSNTGIVISNVSVAGDTITFNVSMNTRLVTFNPQGGTWGAPGSGTGNLTRTMIQSATTYATVMNTNNTALLSPTQIAPTRAGYTFVGWFTAATGGTRVNHNTAVTPGAAGITLHAQWRPTDITLTQNAPSASAIVTAGVDGRTSIIVEAPATGSVIITAPAGASVLHDPMLFDVSGEQIAVHNDGRGFIHTVAAGTTFNGFIGTVGNVARTFTVNSTWPAAARTVTFNPQGGTWSAPGSGAGSLTRTMAQSATTYATVMNTNNTALLNPAQEAPTRAGFTFAGWFTASVGGTRVNHNTPVIPGATGITLHAQWTAVPMRTITFNPQGGTWSAPGSGIGNLTRTMNQSATTYATVMNTNNTALLNPAQIAPTREGHTFAGWFTAAIGGTRVNHNTPVTPGATGITLHAQWIPLTRTVTFNPQGGVWSAPGSGTGNLTRTMNQSATNYTAVMNTNNTSLLNSAQEAPTRIGFTFVGWFTAAIGGTRVNHNTAVIPGATAITLHAQWTPIGSCQVVAEGRLTNQAGVNGILGAPWRLCEDGTLVVDEGFINWTSPITYPESPWHAHRANINRIVFTGPITAGATINNLFSWLGNVTEIEGLTYFDTSRVTSMTGLFGFTHQLRSIDLSSFDTSNVRSMGWMFWRTDSLTTIDLSSFDTSNVTSMFQMFAFTTGLTELDISHFNTSNVTTMNQMFSNTNLETIDLSSLNTSRVTNMDSMFSHALRLTNLNLSSFDTSRVTSMNNMFMSTNALRQLTLGRNFAFAPNASLPAVRQTADFTGFWQNVGNGTVTRPRGNHVLTSAQLMALNLVTPDTWVWQPTGTCQVIAEGQFANQAGVNGIVGASWTLCADGTLEVDEGFINWTSPVTTLSSPWHDYRAQINRIIFTGPITAGTSLQHLFAQLEHVTEIEGLTYFDTSNVWSMNGLFAHNRQLRSLDLSSFDTSNVRNMGWMFGHTDSLEELDVSSFDTSNVTSMFQMFWRTSVRTLDLSHFDTSNVTTMNQMFSNTNLETIDLLNFDTSRVTDMGSMFSSSQFTSLDLSNFDTSRVTNMSSMFSWTRELTNLDLSSFDTNRVTNMNGMFSGENGLEYLDLSNFDTAQVTNMGGMFRDSSQFTSLDLSNFDTSNVTDMSFMFFRANPLTSLDISSFDTSNVTNMSNMFGSTTDLRQLTLGRYFTFATNAGLPAVPTISGFTGMWQNVGNGTVNNPTGTRIFTSAQLMAQFNGQTMADTWVWQPVR